ncbi:MAG: hypothetical protein ACOC9Y_05875 [Chloroflexota bacterium]
MGLQRVREQLRAIAFAVLMIGIILTLTSLFADQLALGMPGSGFGWKQITGTVVGLAITALGLWMSYRLRMTELTERGTTQ